MGTIRRLYFYSLSLISLEVIVWGVIGLLRTLVSQGVSGAASLFANGLSLLLVGVPIFLIHWRTAQRSAMADAAERGSQVRAVFLYAALLATLFPLVFAVIAMLNRGLVQLFGLTDASAWFGEGQTVLDNLIAGVVNGAALGYFWYVLREDWRANPPDNHLAETRRLYRYTWVVSGLILLVTGAANLIRYLVALPGQDSAAGLAILAGGLALTAVGAPIWYVFWQLVQQGAAKDMQERASLLRLVVLYLISLAGVIGVLTFAGSVVSAVLNRLLGEQQSLGDFLLSNSTQVGGMVTLGGVWWYYGRMLNQEVAAISDRPRQAALGRLYAYILALLGLAVTLAGLYNLVDFISQWVFNGGQALADARSLLSGGLSSLLVGLPLWLIPWRRMQQEARRTDMAGDHARRSVARKSFLYLALFALVIGVMVFAGQMINLLLKAALTGSTESNLEQQVTLLGLALIIDAGLLVYHLRVVRQDGRAAQQSLGSLHAGFPTLVLYEGNQEYSRAFCEAFVEDVRRAAARLPVKQHPIERGAPDDVLLGAKALLLPVGVALNPPESLKLWLDEYHGQRLLVPEPQEGWVWLGQSGALDPKELARRAAQTVRQMAEGESLRPALTTNPWAITGYILGGIFGLILLSILFSFMMSALFR